MTFDRAWAICDAYEKANQMSSEEFVAMYRRGEVNVNPVSMRWLSTYDAMLELAPEADFENEVDLLISA